MKLNPMSYTEDDITSGLKQIIENNGEYNSNTISNFSKTQKELIIGILHLSKKYNIKINNSENGYSLLDKMLASSDINDYGIAKYIYELLGKMDSVSIIDPQDRKNLNDLHEEVAFFWSIDNGWKPLDIEGNLLEVLGYTKSELTIGNIQFRDLIHPDDVNTIEEEVGTYTKMKLPNFYQEYRLRKKNGEYIYIKDKTICKYNTNGEILYYYGYISDITQLKQTYNELENSIKQLEKNRYINSITGLPNREQLCLDLEKNNEEKILFLLKINNFSNINTLYGFEQGDNILQLIIDKLKEIAKKEGFRLYNTGHTTNFGITIDNIEDYDKTIININKLLQNFTIDSYVGKLHIDIFAGGAISKGDIYNKALKALYSHDQNKSEVTMFSEELDDILKNNSKENIEWRNKITKAIQENSFYPVYQGIRDNSTGEIIKYEALIRLDDENGEEIQPYKFLDHAENMGKLTHLSKIMVNKVLKDMKTHTHSISINLTKDDIIDEDFINYINNELVKNKINPNRLIIEILENITTDGDILIENIKKLKEIGVQISIDDFGTGYSNFERLMDIDVDFLKIDGSLVKEISTNKDKVKILRLIHDLAKIKKAKTIAEFVDNTETQDIIEMLGIDFTQGYLFSKPKKRNLSQKQEG